MSAFVGVKQVPSAEELTQLLEKLPEPSYYFLRWPHEVSGIVKTLSKFPSPEGQMFNSQFELRWKQQGSGYELLFLGKVQPDAAQGFQEIGSDRKPREPVQWKIIDRLAYLYRSDETRFPQNFLYEDIKIGQRYFIDAKTSTTHFVALTVTE